MITSDRQLSASQKKVDMLVQSLDKPTVEGVPEVVIAGGKAQIGEFIDEIKAEITEYEELKSSKISDFPMRSIKDITLLPIRYRISEGMTVEAFSRKVGVSLRQINRYEAAEYTNVTTSTLTQIVEKLGVNFEGHISA